MCRVHKPHKDKISRSSLDRSSSNFFRSTHQLVCKQHCSMSSVVVSYDISKWSSLGASLHFFLLLLLFQRSSTNSQLPDTQTQLIRMNPRVCLCMIARTR